MIRLRLLGSVELKRASGEELRAIIAQPKPMALLAYLAAATPVGYHRREQLLSVFWPELDSNRGRRALSQALHVLRSELEEGAVSARGVEEIGIDRTIVSSDVDDFRAAIERKDWGSASELYRGELLSGFLIPGSPEFDQWLDRERSRLRGQAIDSAWHLSDAAEASGDSAAAHRWARRAMELDPYSEQGVRRLLSLFDRTGNRADAIRTYDEFRDRMASELESEPSKETRALAESLKEQPSARRVSKPRITAAAESPVVEAPATPALHVDSKRSWSWLVVPFIAIVLIAAIALTNNRSSKQPAPAVTNRVVIAEFESAPEDTALGRTITEALRLDLSRSNLIKVMSDATARDALVLMKRDTLLRITPELAREIAARENIKAVLAGDVRRAANGFVLSVQLISPDGGDIINGWRATARDSSELLQAIDQLSSSVRQDAGESIRAIKSSSPLLRVSTTSLSALRKEAMGIDAFHSEDYRRAVTLLREAIAEDSTFTDAYMMLSTILFNSSVHPSSAIDAATRAYRYRDKLRDAERYAVTFNYLWTVKGDVPAALDAERNAAELDPETVFWGRYASLLMQMQRHRDAELAALRGLQWEPNPFLYQFLAIARFRQGKIDEARRTIAYGLRVYPTSVLLKQLRIDATEATGDYARADSMAHGPDGSLTQRADIDAVLGKLDEARSHFVELRKTQEASGSSYAVMPTWIALARLSLDLSHDTASAIAIADSIPATSEWKALFPQERPYALLAHFYVRAGKLERARALLDDIDRYVPEDYRAHDKWLARKARAMLGIARGDANQIRELKDVYATDPQPVSTLADLGWAYQHLGMSKEAAEVARAYLKEPNPRRIDSDAFNLAAMRSLAR